MHEYAIAQELVAQVETVARENGAGGVTRVVVQVGRLRAVVQVLSNRKNRKRYG